MTDAVPLGKKIQPFWAPTNMTQAQVEAYLATEVISATMPGGKNKEFPLVGMFKVEPVHYKGRDGMVFTPDIEQVRTICVDWCLTLSRMPPKSLPRSQRPMVHILKKLTPEPTGVPAIDKGRNMLLDGVFEKLLWIPTTTIVVQKVAPPSDTAKA